MAEGEEMLIILHQILIQVWEEESKPDDWKESNLHAARKRSDAFFVVITHRTKF
jgi:hypothetical protein